MIGDVTGHGAPSALMTAAIRGAVSVMSRWIEADRTLALEPAKLMKLLNVAIFEAGKSSINMTFLISILDHTRNRLLCANAAHSAGYLIQPEGTQGEFKIRPVGSASLTLGDSPDTEFKVETFDWTPGSKLFVYTDGLIDMVVDGTNLFDRKTLRKTIQAHRASNARALVARVMEQRTRVAKWLPKVDDVTVVVCEALTRTSDQPPADDPATEEHAQA
jgi:sigma-B regulation protein RsbU (phosphoserine phosphatase)